MYNSSTAIVEFGGLYIFNVLTLNRYINQDRIQIKLDVVISVYHQDSPGRGFIPFVEPGCLI